jgi:hypothetical protein
MTAKRVRAGEMKPEVALSLQLGVAALMLLAGGVITLSTLGIIPPDESAGPLARLIALLTGVGVVLLGANLLLAPLFAMAAEEGAHDPVSAAGLGVSRLLGRVDLRSLGAALVLVPLVAGYWGARRGTLVLGWSSAALIDLVLIEFLLIHGFVFLAVAASFARVPEKGIRRTAIAGGILLMALYMAFAWGAGRIWGIVNLLYLMIPNVLAFARPADAHGHRVTAGARWVVKLVTLFGIAILLDETSLQGEGNLEIGLIYFGLQVFVELFRVAEIPIDLGPAWTRVPVQKRRALSIQWTDGS